MDKMWLMWIIILKILINKFFLSFFFWPSGKQISVEIWTYWKSLDSSQPFPKSKGIIVAFLKHEKRCSTLIIPSSYWFGWLNILSLINWGTYNHHC